MKILYVIFIAFSIYFSALAQTEDEQTNRAAPNFKLESINGKYVELNSLFCNGPILLSFWATWCIPCQEELAEYNKFFNEYSEKGLTLIAISTDTEKSVAKVKPFIKSKNYKFEVLLDTNSEAARKFYAQQVPFTVLIDKNGKIIYTHMGYMKGDEIKVKDLIEELVKN